MELRIGKRHVWVEKTYFKSKFIKKYIDFKFIISKILSIIFIIAIQLLSHINVAFQIILVWLNLSESLSKHEGYEYNLIFKAVTHLF